MPFQSVVQFFQGFGVPGQVYTDEPHRAQPFILQSALASYNVIGATVFTVVSEGIAQAGGTGAFAGFLIDPQVYALGGVNGQPLSPTLTLPNQTEAELLTMGSIVVTLPAAAAIGDVVLYNTTTGALTTVTPGTTPPGGTAYANAFVDRYTVTAAGLAVITVNPPLINV